MRWTRISKKNLISGIICVVLLVCTYLIYSDAYQQFGRYRESTVMNAGRLLMEVEVQEG